MTKKSGSSAKAGGPAAGPTQSQLDELYTAHQVHTLAQLIFQQVVARKTGGSPWASAAGTGMPSATQPLVYWYS